MITLYVLGEDGRRDRTIPSVIDGTLGDANAAFDLLIDHLRRVGAHKATQLDLCCRRSPVDLEARSGPPQGLGSACGAIPGGRGLFPRRATPQ